MPRTRAPSMLHTDVRNLRRVLARYTRRGDRFLEVGCAPGKMLLMVADQFAARVAGIDYSPVGIGASRRLFDAVGVPADLRSESIFETTFQPVFDVVYSAGLIEHFDDPRPIVCAHVELTRPGGWTVITIPHYGGIYGRLQHHFQPDNLEIHNTSIMSVPALRELAPADLVSSVDAYASGRPLLALVGLGARWPRLLAKASTRGVDAFSLLLPFDIPGLEPLLVLAMRRAD